MEHLSRRYISDTSSGNTEPGRQQISHFPLQLLHLSCGHSRHAPDTVPNRHNKRRSIRYRPSAGWIEETLKANLPRLNREAPIRTAVGGFPPQLGRRLALEYYRPDAFGHFGSFRPHASLHRSFIGEPRPTAIARDRFAPIREASCTMPFAQQPPAHPFRTRR